VGLARKNVSGAIPLVIRKQADQFDRINISRFAELVNHVANFFASSRRPRSLVRYRPLAFLPMRAEVRVVVGCVTA
jgi:hypothetical protein